MLPVGTHRAHSLPSISATRSCKRLTVGSSPYTSSPTSASAIALRMPGVGFVTVSLRRSRRSMRYCESMPRESKEAKSARARRVVAKLDEAMPEARIALEYENELQLLVAVMLSAQATDAVVNTVTPSLFAKYRTADDYARASVPELEKAIRRIGLYRGKARNLHAAMQRIARDYGGMLPRTREELY